MNPFVNPKKRDFQLPDGCKDLIDALRVSNESSRQSKCEYCAARAVASFWGKEEYRWCGECQEDLKKFAALEIKDHFKVEYDKFHNEAALSQYHAEMQRRQDDFMRFRVQLREWIGEHRKKKPE